MTLSELRKIFREGKVPITEFGGWYCKTGKDSWGIVDDTVFMNYKPVTIKDIKQYCIDNRFVRKKAIKITANVKEEEHVG